MSNFLNSNHSLISPGSVMKLGSEVFANTSISTLWPWQHCCLENFSLSVLKHGEQRGKIRGLCVALKRSRVQKCQMSFRDHLLQAQKWSSPMCRKWSKGDRRLSWRNRFLLTKFNHGKKAYQRQKQGQEAEEEYGDSIWACSDGVRKARVYGNCILGHDQNLGGSSPELSPIAEPATWGLD